MKKSSFSRSLSSALFACLFVVCVSAWGLTSNVDFQRSGGTARLAATDGRHASDDAFDTLAFMRSSIDDASMQQLAAASSLSTDAGDFASFDFANGTRYPERATASVGPATYRPGSTIAYVPISLDRPTPNTVIARVMTEDGTGLVRGVAGINYQPIYKSVIFRPGDPLTKTVEVPIILGIPGADFIVRFVEAPWGGMMGTDRAYVQCDVQKEATPAQTEGREPRTFSPSGTLQWRMSRDTLKWSDAGHDKAWSTKLRMDW